MKGVIRFGTSRLWADLLLDKYFTEDQGRVNCQAASSKGAFSNVMISAAVSPAAVRSRIPETRYCQGFEPPTPGRDPKVSPYESGGRISK